MLWYQLDSAQLSVYRALRAAKASRRTLRCARRWGKTHLLLTCAMEDALRHPGARINYAAQTGKSVREMLRPMFLAIARDCPADLRPTWKEQAGRLEFKNGASIVLAGGDKDDSIERLRGPGAVANYIDEAGALPRLRYLLEDVLEPQLLTTGGSTFIASTPPEQADHQFCAYSLRAESMGAGWYRTLFDNPRVASRVPGWIQEHADAAGLSTDDYRQTVGFRREYMAELLTDPEKSVVPEFNEAAVARIVREPEATPAWRDLYVALDIGHREDWTAALFGYWWFDAATLVVEDELLIRRMTTQQLAEGLKAKEFELWGGNARVHLRVSDIAPQVTADLAQIHDYPLADVSKQDKDAAINQVRMLVGGQHGRLIIRPRCKRLIEQLRSATWNRSRTSFERTDQMGHYDAVDALVYLVRSVQRHHNPYPLRHGQAPGDQHIPREKPEPVGIRTLRKALRERRPLVPVLCDD